jgi:hypothetical protein
MISLPAMREPSESILFGAHLRQALSLLDHGLHREAAARFARALEIRPADPLALGYRALCLWQLGEAEACRRLARRMQAVLHGPVAAGVVPVLPRRRGAERPRLRLMP